MIYRENIDIRGGMYGIINFCGEKEYFKPIGKEFCIDKIECCFEDEKIYLTLSTEYGGRIVKEKISRDDLTQNGMNVLAGKGFDVKNVEFFQTLISLLEEEYFQTYDMLSLHRGIGWDKLETGFQKDLLQSDEGYVYKRFNHIDKIKSRYVGGVDIKPKGNYNNQKQFIKDEVCGYTPCEIAVAVGLSAVLNGRIRDIVHTPNLIVHFYGDSSRGKTTAAQLAISVAGVPDMQKTSLFMSWNATYNAIITRLKMNRGMPVAMDEISKYNGNDMTNVIYALSDGRDKDRLNKNATLKATDKADSFSTTIISTGEAGLISKCKNNTGLKARVIEIDTLFTKSAAHSNIIKSNCMENCGHLAPRFAKYMQFKGIDYVIARYNYWFEVYLSRTTVSSLKERISENYALILTAADLANDVFKFNFDIEKMIDFFVKNESENDIETNIAKTAYEKMIDFAKTNRGHFVRYNTKANRMHNDYIPNNDSIELYGRIDENLKKSHENGKIIVSEYSFTREAFKKIITKLGYEDDKILLKKFKEAGYLNHEENKLYRKRKLRKEDSSNTKMYVLYAFDDDLILNDVLGEKAEKLLDDSFDASEEDYDFPL